MGDFYLCYPTILTNTLVPQLGLSSVLQNQLGVALDALTVMSAQGPIHSQKTQWPTAEQLSQGRLKVDVTQKQGHAQNSPPARPAR